MPTPPTPAYLDSGMNVGIASYNGYVFPPAISCKVQIEPVYETSRRAVKWWKHTMTLEFVVVPQLNPIATLDPAGAFAGTACVDVNVESLKRTIQVPGAELVFTLKGLGTAEPNTNANTFVVNRLNDLDFGPKPILLTWESIGSNKAIRVQWSVEFNLLLCCYNDYFLDGVCDNPAASYFDPNNPHYTEFSYSMSWSVDDEGWTQRVLVGTAETFSTFTNLGEVPGGGTGLVVGGIQISTPMPNATRSMPLAIVQNHIANLFPRLPGFHRSWQWDLSRDGRTLAWRIADTEIHSDNPYMAGIIKCDAVHGMQADGPAFFKWNAYIRGNFTLMPNVPRQLGWSAFVILVANRLLGLQLATAEILKEFDDNNTLTKIPVVPTYLPTSLSFEEEIYGRSFSFEFLYTVFCSWQQVMAANRFFRPVVLANQQTDWIQWQAAMPPEMRTGRGAADLSSAGNNNIVVRCTAGTTASNTATINGRPEGTYLAPLFQIKCPKEDESWVDYKLWFTVHNEDNTVTHQKSYLPDDTMYQETGSQTAAALRGSPFVNNTLGYPNAEVQYNANYTDQGNVFQAVSKNRWFVTMHGYGIRACYDIPVPELMQFGANTSVPRRQKGHTMLKHRLGTVGPVPIYCAKWRITYELMDPPTGQLGHKDIKTTGVPEDYLNGKQMDTIITP